LKAKKPNPTTETRRLGESQKIAKIAGIAKIGTSATAENAQH